jgi:hypothetical protein
MEAFYGGMDVVICDGKVLRCGAGERHQHTRTVGPPHTHTLLHHNHGATALVTVASPYQHSATATAHSTYPCAHAALYRYSTTAIIPGVESIIFL